jgi:hypothetical protein
VYHDKHILALPRLDVICDSLERVGAERLDTDRITCIVARVAVIEAHDCTRFLERCIGAAR